MALLYLLFPPLTLKASGFGAISGQIVYEGELSEKVRKSGVVEKEKPNGVRWATAVLESSEARVHPALKKDNKLIARVVLAKGRLEPIVSVLRTGGRLEVVNNDTDTSLIKLLGTDINEADFVMPGRRLSVVVDAEEKSPGVWIQEVDGIHRQGWVVVMSTPYMSISDTSGRFTIDLIPEGTHELRLWNPFVRFSRLLHRSKMTVTIRANETTKLHTLTVNESDFE